MKKTTTVTLADPVVSMLPALAAARRDDRLLAERVARVILADLPALVDAEVPVVTRELERDGGVGLPRGRRRYRVVGEALALARKTRLYMTGRRPRPVVVSGGMTLHCDPPGDTLDMNVTEYDLQDPDGGLVAVLSRRWGGCYWYVSADFEPGGGVEVCAASLPGEPRWWCDSGPVPGLADGRTGRVVLARVPDVR